MPLYTIASSDKLPAISKPTGLVIKKSTDVALLAKLAETNELDIEKRFAENHLAFVAWYKGEPAAFGWMAQSTARIGELNHEITLPEGNSYLWNFRTLEQFRGLGIYPALLQYIISNTSVPKKRYWIIHAPENIASSRGIVKAGFKYAGKLSLDKNGVTKLEAKDLARSLKHQLQFMGIPIASEKTASCWNCNSPYLKKRKRGCCCTDSDRVCNNSKELSKAA